MPEDNSTTPHDWELLCDSLGADVSSRAADSDIIIVSHIDIKYKLLILRYKPASTHHVSHLRLHKHEVKVSLRKHVKTNRVRNDKANWFIRHLLNGDENGFYVILIHAMAQQLCGRPLQELFLPAAINETWDWKVKLISSRINDNKMTCSDRLHPVDCLILDSQLAWASRWGIVIVSLSLL